MFLRILAYILFSNEYFVKMEHPQLKTMQQVTLGYATKSLLRKVFCEVINPVPNQREKELEFVQYHRWAP